MPSIVISNLLKGLKPDPLALNSSSHEVDKFEYAQSNGIDFHRVSLHGHMTPAQIFSTGKITNANINSHVRASAADAGNSFTYLILGGLSGTNPRVERLETGVYAATGTRQITLAAGHAAHNFTTVGAGTGFWGEDIVIYNVGGTNYVFYSWNDNTDGDVGRATLVSGAPTYADDWMSTTPASAGTLTKDVPHRMVVGGNGKLYITNGRYLAEFDGATGANGTLNTTKYDAGQGWIITDIRNYKSLLAVSCINSGPTYRVTNYNQISRINLWNMVEPGLGLVYEMSDGNVSAMFVGDDGRLYAWTQGKLLSGKLRRFNGNEFAVIKEYPSSGYGTPPQPNAIESYYGKILWLPGNSIGNLVMAYDPKFDALHVPYYTNDNTNDATSAGILKNFDNANLYVGMLSSSTYELAYTSGNAGYKTNVQLKTSVYRLPFKSIITKVKIFFSQMAASSTGTFSLFPNYAAMVAGSSDDKLNLVLDNATYGALTEFEYARTIPNISAFYMNINLSGQISVAAIVVEYEPMR